MTHLEHATGVVEAVCTRSTPSPVMKKPLTDEVTLDAYEGVRGDIHAGRSERQVALLPAEVLDALQGEGFAVGPGDMGENLVLRGLPAEAYTTGARLEFEDGAIIEVVQARNPCRELEDVAPGLLKAAVRRCGHFAKVVEGGRVHAGLGVRVAVTVRV